MTNDNYSAGYNAATSTKLENENWIYKYGYTLTNDYLTTGLFYSILFEKPSMEEHSGPDDLLLAIYNGRKTLNDLYPETTQ